MTARADLSGAFAGAVARLALCKRDQDSAARLADHRVGLPVPDAGAFLNDPWSLVDQDPAPDLAPAVIAP